MFGRRKSLEMSATQPLVNKPVHTGKFHIFRGGNKQYYWHLVSRNGKILAQSEGYERRDKCIKTVKRIQEVASYAPIVTDK